MKKTVSVVIGTPHNRDLTPEYVLSLIGMLRSAPLHIGVAFYESCLVNVGRNTIAQGSLTADYLLFIDSDMEFPVWGLERLLSHDKDIVGGLYYKKGEPHCPLVYEKTKMDYECIQNPPTELFECDGLGTGFLLIKQKVLKDLFNKDFAKKNGFPFNFMQKPDGNFIGEDLAFCLRAKKKGYKVWCDPTIPIKHIGLGVYDSNSYYKSMKELAALDVMPYDNKIEGWMTKEELNWLYKVASTADSVIELGSWMGKSTHALCTACKGTVTAIDHFKGSPGEVQHIGIKPYDKFKKNVSHFKNLKVLKMSTDKALDKVEPADIVFIDASHTYEAVKNDLEKWTPKAKKIICGHDFQWTGVQRAVTEKFGFVHTCGTIWYKQL
jgi:predicted O-methyltransferase YrrM